MIRFGKYVGIAALVGAFGLVGCADETAATDAPEEAEGVAQAPIQDAPRAATDDAGETRRPERRDRGERGERGPKGKRGHGGPDQLIRAALSDLDLNGAQRATIEDALETLHEGRPERPEKGASPFAAIAEQVRAGQIDAVALEGKLAEGRPDHGAKREALAKALGTVHTTLSREQRRALVDGVTKRMAEREAKLAEKGDRAGKGERRGRGPEGKHAGGPLRHLVRDLDLTAEQQAKVDAALAGLAPTDADRAALEAKHEEMRARMKAGLESFAGDRFDAAALLPAKGAMKPDHHAKMAQALAAIVPVLDASQRDALADRLEEGPKGFRGKGGEGHRGKVAR